MIKFLDRIMTAAAVLAGALIVLVMLMVCAKVFSRYFFGVGIVGVDQISGTLLVYVTFLAAAWVLRREQHVTIDILLSSVGDGPRRWMNIVASLLGAAVCFLLMVYGTLEVWQSWQRGVRVAAELEIYRAYNLAVIPLGSFLLFIQLLRRAGLHLRGAGQAN